MQCEGPSALIAPLYAEAYQHQLAAAPTFLEDTTPCIEFAATVGADTVPVQVFYLESAEKEYFLIQVRLLLGTDHMTI